MAREALIVIDMLNDFVRGGGALYIGEAARELVPAVEDELKKARSKAVPVVYVCDSHRRDDPEFRMFPPHGVAGTEGALIADPVAPQPPDRIVPKRRYSGFFQTDLDLTLRELGVREVVLVGCCTNICVLYTAADARNLGYEVVVPRRAVASFDTGAHEFALGEMERVLGVKVR